MSITYGKLASLRPVNLLEATLYTVPADTYLNGMLRVVNHTGDEQTYSLAQGASAPAATADFLSVDKPIIANWTEEFTVAAGPGEKIQVKAGSINAVGFHLSGQLKTDA